MQPNMQKYQLTEEEMISVLNKSKYGVLSTIGEDGFPYGVPVNFVYLDGKIYIHGRKIGEKVMNTRGNTPVTPLPSTKASSSAAVHTL